MLTDEKASSIADIGIQQLAFGNLSQGRYPFPDLVGLTLTGALAQLEAQRFIFDWLERESIETNQSAANGLGLKRHHGRLLEVRTKAHRSSSTTSSKTMELNQLIHFLKVAEHHGFTRAAEALVMSQPALSRSIARLEEELGQPLFERRTRSVELTEAGKLLEGRARQILSLIEDTISEISDDGSTGRLRIGAIPTIAPFLLPNLLRGFAELQPQCQLTVQEETTERLVHQVQQGEVDVAILALPISAKYLESRKLFDEELLLVMPNDHELAARKKISLGDVQSYPFVLLGEAHCLSDTIVSFCRRGQFQPVSVERTSQLATVQELVSLGHGVSFIPQMARALDQSNRRLYRSLSGEVPTRTIGIIWNPYRFQSRLMQAFIEHVQEAAPRTQLHDRTQ